MSEASNSNAIKNFPYILLANLRAIFGNRKCRARGTTRKHCWSVVGALSESRWCAAGVGLVEEGRSMRLIVCHRKLPRRSRVESRTGTRRNP